MSSEMAVKMYFTEDYMQLLAGSEKLNNNMSISINLTYGVYESGEGELYKMCKKHRFLPKFEIIEKAARSRIVNGKSIVRQEHVDIKTVKHKANEMTTFHCHRAQDDNYHFFKKLTQKQNLGVKGKPAEVNHARIEFKDFMNVYEKNMNTTLFVCSANLA